MGGWNACGLGRSSRKFWQLPWLELLLILSALALVLQIAGPRFVRWWQLPRPGTLGIDTFPSDFFEENNAQRCLAPGYAGFLPKGYSPANSYPLVVFLHGSGGRGNDPQNLLKWGRFLTSQGALEEAAVVLMPQCLKQTSWQPEEVVRFVEYACQRYPIDRERIYLMGFSMGGYGAWHTAGKCENLFAAIVPIAGGGNMEDAARLLNTPIWAFHGTVDKAVPVEQTTAMIDAIREAGGDPKLTLLEEAGHGIPREVCEIPELWQWLFEQKRSHSEQPSKGATDEERGN